MISEVRDGPRTETWRYRQIKELEKVSVLILLIVADVGNWYFRSGMCKPRRQTVDRQKTE